MKSKKKRLRNARWYPAGRVCKSEKLCSRASVNTYTANVQASLNRWCEIGEIISVFSPIIIPQNLLFFIQIAYNRCRGDKRYRPGILQYNLEQNEVWCYEEYDF